jgi:hypothetical protein
MRIADTVYTRQADIDRIQALITRLGNDDRVALTLADGRELRGIVAFKPTIQQFFDRSGREGSNALVRLDQPALEAPDAAGWIDVALGDVVSVRHLDRHELEPWYPGADDRATGGRSTQQAG